MATPMPPSTKWNGALVEVRARVVPRYFFTTVSIDVYVNDNPILRTGGQLKRRGGVEVQFQHKGAWHHAELSWGKFTDNAFPFLLTIDGEEVLASAVRVEGLGIACLAWLLVLAGIATIIYVIRG